MKSFYKENELSNTSLITYLGLVNKPTIEELELEGNLAADELGTYNIQAIERLVNGAKKINIVSELPEDPEKNTLYYVGTQVPYDLYVYDDNLQLIFLGKNASQSFTTNSEGISITSFGATSLLETYYDSRYFHINDKGELSGDTISVGDGLILRDNQILDINFDPKFNERGGGVSLWANGGRNVSPTGYKYRRLPEASFFNTSTILDIYHPTVNTSVVMRVTVLPTTENIPNPIQLLGDSTSGWRLCLLRQGDRLDLRFDLEGEGEVIQDALKYYEPTVIEVGNNYVKVEGETIWRGTPKGFDSPRDKAINILENKRHPVISVNWVDIYESDQLIDHLIPVESWERSRIPIEESIRDAHGFYGEYTQNYYYAPLKDDFTDANYSNDDTPSSYINWGAGVYADMGGQWHWKPYYTEGLVPTPPKNSANAVLRADGLWDDMCNDAMVGEIRAWAGNEPPVGWLLCDGSLVSRTKYRTLFGVIKDMYELKQNVDNPTPSPVPQGIGFFITDYFALPDLRQRFVIGANTPDNVGEAALPKAPRAYAELGVNMYKQRPGFSMSGNGAFYIPSWRDTNGWEASTGYTVWGTTTAKFDMSEISDIYGKSNTVQPEAVAMNYIIKY